MKEGLLKLLQDKRSIFFENPHFDPDKDSLNRFQFTYRDILDAKERLERFIPYLKERFPETKNGVIESEIREVPEFKKAIEQRYSIKIKGRVFVKMDNTLPIAGSIKARGGIYEVLKVAEDILIEHGFLKKDANYSKLMDSGAKDILSEYTIVVGSTGNLGLSVGIISSALGFRAEVHMSRDAKEWKKRLLKDWGAKVIEHDGDYLFAVSQGRKRCEGDNSFYFVDDENSRELFLGYAVAALSLKKQLTDISIVPKKEKPLYVYIPCGVGGAAGGISFGLAHVFGYKVRSYVAEPVAAPCVVAALITGKDVINTEDIGIKLSTEADGLAVASPSKLAMPILRRVLAGGYTLTDEEMVWAAKTLYLTEGIKIELSAGAGVKGVYLVEKHNTEGDHLIWLTGGRFLPQEEFDKLISSL